MHHICRTDILMRMQGRAFLVAAPRFLSFFSIFISAANRLIPVYSDRFGDFNCLVYQSILLFSSFIVAVVVEFYKLYFKEDLKDMF